MFSLSPSPSLLFPIVSWAHEIRNLQDEIKCIDELILYVCLKRLHESLVIGVHFFFDDQPQFCKGNVGEGSVDSSIPVVEESVLPVEDLEEVVSDDEEEEDANDFEWEAGLEELDQLCISIFLSLNE